MKIEHVAMYVNDLEAAKEFFVKYLNGTATTTKEPISAPTSYPSMMEQDWKL